MKTILSVLSLCLTLTACAAPSIVTGNSRSVTIDDGQYTEFTHGTTDSEVAVKDAADKWCAKYGRVSGTEKNPSHSRTREFECVSK